MHADSQSDEAYLSRLLGERAGAERLAPDEIYLRIWELEQANTNTRWTNTTFFLSVSFAIFGFSFQAGLGEPLPLGARLIALAIYWFAYLLFRRFNMYTALLRDYLYQLERNGQTTITVQARTRATLRSGRRERGSSTNLLLYFGFLYSLSVPLLWLTTV